MTELTNLAILIMLALIAFGAGFLGGTIWVVTRNPITLTINRVVSKRQGDNG